MYVVYCECGYNVTFSDSEVNQMKYGLPTKIYCGECKNRGVQSVCSIVRSED